MTEIRQLQYGATMGGLRRPGPWPWRALLVWIAIWILPALIVGLAFSDGSRFNLAMMFGIAASLPVGIATIIFIPVSINFLMRHIRMVRARAVLAHVEQAVCLNLPLVRYLSAACASEKRAVRVRLNHLVDYLSKGLSVSSALRESTPEIPERTIGILAAAENAGCLKEVLSRQYQRETSRKLPTMDAQIFGRLYPVMLLLILVMSVTGIMIFVIPKFKEIFRDFRTSLPGSMEDLLSVSNFFSEDAPFLGPLILYAFVLLSIGPLIIEVLLPREQKLLRLARLRELFCWYFPFARSLTQSRNFSDLFYALSDSFAAARPANLALIEAGDIPLNAVLSRRLHEAGAMVAAGAPLPNAFTHIGFPDGVCEMLATAVQAGTLPETCRFIADVYASRHSRIAIVVRSSVEVVITLTLGFLVYSVVAPIMMSLTKLINSVIAGSAGDLF